MVPQSMTICSLRDRKCILLLFFPTYYNFIPATGCSLVGCRELYIQCGSHVLGSFRSQFHSSLTGPLWASDLTGLHLDFLIYRNGDNNRVFILKKIGFNINKLLRKYLAHGKCTVHTDLKKMQGE